MPDVTTNHAKRMIEMANFKTTKGGWVHTYDEIASLINEASETEYNNNDVSRVCRAAGFERVHRSNKIETREVIQARMAADMEKLKALDVLPRALVLNGADGHPYLKVTNFKGKPLSDVLSAVKVALRD